MSEPASDPEHLHELETIGIYQDIEKARQYLKWHSEKNPNLYARIEMHTEEYTPAPIGRKYKDERYGWSMLKSEVIEEN